MHEKESLSINIGLIKANFILKVLVHSYFFHNKISLGTQLKSL